MGFRIQYKSDEDIARDLDDQLKKPQPMQLWEVQPTIQERFERFIEHHPEVYEEFKGIALTLITRGVERYGSKAIMEVLRYNRTVSGRDGSDPFKINNDFSSRLARKLAMEDKRFIGFFEFRGLKSA